MPIRYTEGIEAAIAVAAAEGEELEVSGTFAWNIGDLSPTHKKIADYLEKNIDRLPYLTERDIANEVRTSIATVSRFWQAVGHASLKSFKTSVRNAEAVTPANKMKAMFNKLSADDLLCDLLEQTAGYLRDTSYNLARESFELAATAIAEGTRLHVFAPGPSEGLGHLLQFRLNRIGIDARLVDKHGNQLFEFLIQLKPQDTLVLFGFYTLVPEIKVLLDYAEELGCRTIVITDRLVSDLNGRKAVLLYACRGQIGDFHSMVAPTALVESLAIAAGRRIEQRALAHLEHLQTLRRRYAHLIPK